MSLIFPRPNRYRLLNERRREKVLAKREQAQPGGAGRTEYEARERVRCRPQGAVLNEPRGLTPGITRRAHNVMSGKSCDESNAIRGRVHAVVMLRRQMKLNCLNDCGSFR